MPELTAAVRRQIAAIREDNTHGASQLARDALRTVGACARESTDLTAAQLLDRVHACIDELGVARPEMAPIRFWVERLRAEIDRAADSAPDVGALRDIILRQVDSLVERSERAGQHVVENAVAHLPTGSVVFTASFSQTVVNACRLASERGKLRALLVSESVDAADRRHGRLLAAAIGPVSATVEVISDDLAPGRVAEADRVWLGADTVLPDGSVLNGTPSLAIAEAAVAAGRPVEIICEAAKVEPRMRSAEDERRLAEAFDVPAGMDRLPSELISAVITENGVERGVGGEAVPDLVARIAERLSARGEKLGVIETAAGGRICDALTDRPGSSAWFAGGIVAYSGVSMSGLAGVSEDVTKKHGAVSGPTAQALADAARERFGTAWGIGETGIAGPQTGRRSAKPAGLAYVAVSGPGDRRRVVELNTGLNDRAGNKQAFARAALTLLVEQLTARAE
jgi:PncC family amidohydrolase